MSIKSLIGDSEVENVNRMEDYKFPTKVGLIFDRYKELRSQAWGGKQDDTSLGYMSKFVKK
jgi:hypothetical protein